VVEKLISDTDSSFTNRVADFQLLNKFKTSQIPAYTGEGDPAEHLENYKTHLSLHKTLMRWHAWLFFSLCLGMVWEVAHEFHCKLKGSELKVPNTVSSFADTKEILRVLANNIAAK
jgi:hypothetical protein